MAVAANTSGFVALPAELLGSIAGHLANRDIKSLRLTCRRARDTVLLRLPRLFLSAHRRDVDVFSAVADHETLRRGVKEIVWDDGLFRLFEPYNRHGLHFEVLEMNVDYAFTDNERPYRVRYPDDPLPPLPPPLPMPASFAHYRRLFLAQEGVIARSDHVRALRHGLARFPALRRLTVTPAAHGAVPAKPLYDTPTIRALPRGFCYPLPRPWSLPPPAGFGADVRWDGTDAARLGEPEGGAAAVPAREKRWRTSHWHGVCHALAVLADAVRQAQAQAPEQPDDRPRPCVPELVLDAHQLDAGLSCLLFSEAHSTYHDLLTVVGQPGFRRLDLPLDTDTRIGNNSAPTEDLLSTRPELRGGPGARALVREALEAIGPDLEHLRVSTNMLFTSDRWSVILRTAHVAVLRPLKAVLRTAVFPPDLGRRWPRLRHFALAGFIVARQDLLALLAELPPALQTLELGDLYFADDDVDREGPDPSSGDAASGFVSHWHWLLNALRDDLGWRARPAGQRPRVSVWMATVDGKRVRGQAMWVDEDSIAAFLYGDGPNPFPYANHYRRFAEVPRASVLRDALDPDYERAREPPPGGRGRA